MEDPKIEFIETTVEDDDTLVQGVIVVCEFKHEDPQVARDCAHEFVDALLRVNGWWEKYWGNE